MRAVKFLRKNKTSIWDGDGYKKPVRTQNYVLPIPDEELKYN